MRMPIPQRGFTLIEVMVVMVVLAILATAAVPMVELSVKRNKERELKQSVWEIRQAIDAYKHAYDGGRVAKVAGASGYPPSLQALSDGVPDLAAGGHPIYFLRRIPRDPLAVGGPSAAQSWGIRSYLSSAEKPVAGVDVFDIYSKSEGMGINGVPYREW